MQNEQEKLTRVAEIIRYLEQRHAVRTTLENNGYDHREFKILSNVDGVLSVTEKSREELTQEVDEEHERTEEMWTISRELKLNPRNIKYVGEGFVACVGRGGAQLKEKQPAFC